MNLTGIWAMMLNNRAKRDSEKVIEFLEINQGDVIADIGSGGGSLTTRLSEKTGSNGKVFAVDTNKALLSYVDKAMKKQHIHNVETVVVKDNGSPLQKESCDLIFMRNVFHHITNPESYLSNIKGSLRPGGRIAIIDWLPKRKGRDNSHTGHYTPDKEIQRILGEAGFTRLKSFDFLNGQSFNIFEK